MGLLTTVTTLRIQEEKGTYCSQTKFKAREKKTFVKKIVYDICKANVNIETINIKR